jgi:predicted PurR-regulated permease PerM
MMPNSPTTEASDSPPWNNTVKLIIGLTIIAILAGLLIRFRSLIGPFLIALVLAYLLQPFASFLHQRLHLGWRMAVSLIYLILLLILIGSLTLSGFALVDQVTRLVNFITQQINQLPDLFNQWSAEPIHFLIFTIDLSQYNLESAATTILSTIQPLVTQLGSLLTQLASSIASTVGWAFFALLISYFILAESGGKRSRLFKINLPGYNQEITRIGQQLSLIWNAFLRGQLAIVLITVVVYDMLLGGLGVSFFFGLAFLAGLARFVPYVGPAIAWAAYGLVAYFQGSTIFGLSPLIYVILVVGLAWLTDVILDNFVVTRLMGDALEVHPAAIAIGSLVSAQLFGIIGVVLAAPVLATLKLLADYITYKLFDENPWDHIKPKQRKPRSLPPFLLSLGRFWQRSSRPFRAWLQRIRPSVD